MLAGWLADVPLIFGFNFFISKPKEFECFKKDEFLKDITLPNWLTDNNQVNKVSRWVTCEPFEICDFNKPYLTDRSLFRASSENWYSQFMLFCDDYDNSEQWLSITMYLAMALSLLIVPSIADKFGRRNVFCFSLATSIIALLVLTNSENSQFVYPSMFAIGLATPGKLIIGLQYFLEFVPSSSYGKYLSCFVLS